MVVYLLRFGNGSLVRTSKDLEERDGVADIPRGFHEECIETFRCRPEAFRIEPQGTALGSELQVASGKRKKSRRQRAA